MIKDNFQTFHISPKSSYMYSFSRIGQGVFLYSITLRHKYLHINLLYRTLYTYFEIANNSYSVKKKTNMRGSKIGSSREIF